MECDLQSDLNVVLSCVVQTPQNQSMYEQELYHTAETLQFRSRSSSCLSCTKNDYSNSEETIPKCLAFDSTQANAIEESHHANISATTQLSTNLYKPKSDKHMRGPFDITPEKAEKCIIANANMMTQRIQELEQTTHKDSTQLKLVNATNAEMLKHNERLQIANANLAQKLKTTALELSTAVHKLKNLDMICRSSNLIINQLKETNETLKEQLLEVEHALLNMESFTGGISIALLSRISSESITTPALKTVPLSYQEQPPIRRVSITAVPCVNNFTLVVPTENKPRARRSSVATAMVYDNVVRVI